ncbi:MAG: SIS domain-containing protein [Phycisphaerales bacterium]|nr:SIS domain-containing protein [Phycisphaerales bacterium]
MSPPAHTTASAALHSAHRALQSLLADTASIARIETVASLLAERFAAGGKVLICGNGGSACDAMHFAEELTGRFRKDRQPLPALACTDPGHITCTANDYGFEEVFARWVRALGKPGDVLILLSTSGNSENILRASAAATDLGLHTVALLGKTGGKLRGTCTHEWIAGGAGEEADRIQELHMLILHTVIECLEVRMFSSQQR